ncbi:alpha/beta-hydrolase [Tilletiaria anomala UBC 951]|uniref:Alpha/beta-hydrolase n=1 Tax=Tilletiaria anomala (strain ATCC 24038 / CBS 436.72 / UBC 951) TaxID=1037660 RepID=A0A066W8Y2_TILAU|nr:alpha/beta-hydrolase [Tilletiaria anomala UBC 951]KDN47539.1 alpha/beta-hydrolase [Tilletiaria anomala UBC 951]
MEEKQRWEKAGLLDQEQPSIRSKTSALVKGLLVFLVAGGLFAIWNGDYFSSLFNMQQKLATSFSSTRPESHNSGSWEPCQNQPGFMCGAISVPKDYFNASAGRAFIAVAKLPASATERLGSIFLNPGGPGGSGMEFVYGFGPLLDRLFEGKYDLIGFDPRGIGKTRPIVNCFGDAQQFEVFKKATLLENGNSLPPNPWSKSGQDDLLRQIKELTALQQAEYTRCKMVMGDELLYMNTATVVRDIDYMGKVLDGPQGKINYIGGSYGTILGAYLVNMLPTHRLGKVVIDGVASAPSWANDQSHTWLSNWMVDTDKAFNWFTNDCSRVGPLACRLAKYKGEAPSAIAHRLDAFLDKLYYEPVAVPDAIRPGVLTSAMARTVLYFSTNAPHSWQRIAHAFADAMEGNGVKLYSILHGPFSPRSDLVQTDMSRAAVVCGDQPPGKPPAAEDLLDGLLRNLKQTSRRFAANVFPIEPDGGCQFHPAIGRTPERFTGPWNNTLDFPMLIVSNTADPITPRASGEEIHKLMGNSSRILLQDSPGHCSFSSASPCTLSHYAAYFVNGTLPKNHELCTIADNFWPTQNDEVPIYVLSEREQKYDNLSQEMTKVFSKMLEDQLPGKLETIKPLR